MTIKLNPLPKSGRTKAEEDRRKAQQQNAAAKKKKTQQKNTAKKKHNAKKDDRKTESPKALGLRLPSVWDNSLPSLSKADQKSALEQMRSRMDEAEKRTVSEKETVERRYNVSDESWQNPLIRTRVSTPDKMDLSRGNSGRTREEMERRDSQRELAQMNPNKWLKASRETVGLKEDEKAGVGLGTIRHGTLNKNAELFSENWDRIPKENQTDAAIQIIYTYGVNDQNRNMVMTAFNNASTYDQRKIMDAVVQTDGWSEVARGMRSTINNAPDAQEALMRQISEDMNVRNGNYLDTFQRAAGKAQVDQYNLQQKEDKIIADWAKENYDTAEAMKYSVMQSVSGWLANTYDAVALAHSDLLNAGQQEDITDGIGAPWRNAKNYEKFGDKVASVGTTVLHDLFRIVGLPISLLSKVTYTPEEVDEITRKLMGVTDWYHEAVRNNQVALEGSNLSETQKTIAEVTGMVIDQIPGIAMAVVGTPAAGMTTFGLQAGGKYGRSAYENGASIEDSVKFGLAAAAAEVATEKLFTGFGYFGKGAASKVLTDTTRKMLDNSAFKDSMTARILKRVVAGGGEATEEMVMELVQPYLERSTYDPTADGATLEEVLRSGGLGFVVAQILGLPANALGVVNDAASAKNEVMATFENRFKDLVSAGQLTPEEAKTKVQEVNDILSGRGSLNVNDVQSETKTDSDTKEVYTDLTKAKEALETKAKGKEVGEEVSVAVVENGVAETWKATVTENGIEKMQLGTTTEEEQQAYLNKAQKMETATNEAERTGYQLNVKEDIIKEVSALSKAFGKNIEFVATDGAVHGYVNDDGKISVNINSSESPARAVIAHEMTHLLENTASYGKLMDLVTENYGSSLDSKREEIKANYEAAGHPLKDSEVDYELMAHFVEEKLLTDKTTVQKLLQKDRSIGQKILDWINNIIQKITGTKEQRMLMDARDLWNKALTENKKAPESGAEKRFSFGGEVSKTADTEALAVARAMAENGESAEFILRETGWFVGTGGRWRYEIDDSKIQYFPAGRPHNPDAVRYDELFNKFVYGTITQDELSELQKINKNDVKPSPHKLDDYILHEELFEAYPELKRIELRFDDLSNGERGYYNHGRREIVIDARLKADPVHTLVHEIQHAIQYIEGFPKGANVDYWRQRISDGFSMRKNDKYIARADRRYAKLFEEAPEELKNMIRAVNRAKIAKDYDLVNELENKIWESKYAKIFVHLDDADFDRRMDRGEELTAEELYYNTAGEIEARDVSNRRRMTADERRDSMPNVDEDAVIADGSQRSYFLVGYTKDGRSVYTSSFPDGMTQEEKENEFKNSIATIFNLGAVELKTNVKKIKVLGDKFTQQKNIYGDAYPTADEKLAKVDLLYDYADILENSKFVMASPEESYINPSVLPKNKAHKGVKYWYKFKNNIVLDGVGYRVMFNIRDLGKDQYSYLIELKKDGTSDLSNTVYENLLRTDQMSHDNIIFDSSEKSNNRFSIGRSDIADKELRDVIKAENRKMKDVFFSRSTVDRNALWDMIYDEEKHIAETGSYRRNVVQDIIDYAYETGYRYKNEDFEPVNSLGKVSIYVSEDYRGEMDSLGGLAEVNKKVFGNGLRFTYKPNKNALDDAYATLQAENQGIMPETMDPSEQVQSIVDVFGRGAYNTLKDLDADEYNPFAEQESPYRMDIEQTVQDAMDSIQALAVKKIAEQSRKEGQQEVNRWVAKQMQKEARNYTVGSVVELNGERGTVTERTTKGHNVSYTITFDNGEVRESVKPDELSVAVTPDLHFDELPKDQQEAWQDPPEGWDISRDLADVAPMPIDMKEYREILYENGITVGVRKLNEWFKREGWLKKADRYYYPTQKALDEGYFKREKYGNRITETGQKYFLDLFLGNKDLFADPEETGKLVLPGAKQAKDSPLEDSEVQNMVAEYEDELTTTGEDYTWAQALTGRGVTYSKDYARNFDAAAQHNPNLRHHLQRLFVRPLETAKKNYAKAVRTKLEEMHAEMKKLGIKKDTEKASAVQWIGEGFYQDKFGETHEYTIEMLREEFPDDWQNIEKAAQYFRRIYDDYLTEINAAREKIYPHPLEDAQDQIATYQVRMERARDKISELRGTISELETVLSAKKAEYANAENNESLAKAIRYNEDRLSKAKMDLGDYISRRSKYAEKIKQIQADIDSGDILRNKRIMPRKDYFHHFQEMTDGLGDVFRLSRNSTEIDPRLEGTSGYTEPKSKFSGITLHRNHGRYKADAIGGMIDYAQAGEYMIHIDPVISQFRSHIMGMANATKDSRNANKLIRWLVQWTNDLAGKTNPADRFLQDVIGREAVQFARKINSRAKANAVVGNLNSATAQIFNLPNLVAHVTDPKAYVEGFADLCKFIAREKSTRDIVKESGFLSERYLDDVINSFDEKKSKKAEKIAAWTLTVGDRYSSALIWFTAHHEAVNKGITNPIEYADDITRRCVAGRGIGEIPITQKSNITQIFAPFQIEVNNAWQLYKEKLGGIKTANTKRDKVLSFTQFLAILIVNFMLNTLTDLLIHRRVVFDPIYVLFQCIADWMNEDEEEETNWAERFVELMGRESGEIISNMPYGSLIAYYAFNNQWAREKIFGDQDPTRFGVGNVPLEWLVGFVDSLASGEDIVDDAVGFLTTFVLPFGGKQAERTWQGLVNTGILPQVKWGWKEGLTFGRVDAPGSYTRDGQFQFPLHTIKSDFGQWVTNVIFGKYATDEGQKYLGKDFENSSIWQNIIGFNKTKERKELSEKGTKVLTDLVKAGADVFEVYDTIRDIQDAEDAYSKRNVLLQSELSADEKASILLGYLTQKDDVESTEKKLNGILAVGLTVDDYLSLTNTKYIIDNDEAYETAQDKAWAFNNALIADGYTTEQIKGISDVMKFWSHIPADTSKFDKLTDLGLDAETTMKVTEALGALEPLPGEKSISTLQKAEAIAKLNLPAEQEVAAMGAAMDKKQYAKYTSMTEFGVTAQTWVDFENALKKADADNNGNGYYDNDEREAAALMLDVSNSIRAVLWQSKDTSIGKTDKTTQWKASRNPFDSVTAAKMIDSYMARLAALEEEEIEEDSGEEKQYLPLSADYRISSEYGVDRGDHTHSGIDLAVPEGSEVAAVKEGTVSYAGWMSGYGYRVVVDHPDGTQTAYSHLSDIGVRVDDEVTAGTIIALSGNTGNSSGPHLHFEIKVDGSYVNPEEYFDFGNGLKAPGSSNYVSQMSAVKSSGGSSSGNGGGSSSGSRSGGGYASSNTSRVASVRTSNQGYINSSGNIVLPRAGGSSGGGSAPVTGRSTKAPTYAAKGLTLPKASDYGTGTKRDIGATSVATTQRTGRTGGSLWNPNILG